MNTTPSNSLVLRLSVLSLTCLLGFGSYFCYDSPAALQSQMEQTLNLTNSEFMSLYAWYSWPNVFLCFVGGYLIDAVLGRRKAGLVFSMFVLVGQAVLAYGTSKSSLWIMDIGRLIFGLGGETLAIVGNAYSVAWFSGSMLNLAFGMVLSVSRLGSTASLNALAPLYDHLNSTNGINGTMTQPEILGETLSIAGLTCVGSFLIALALCFLDKKFMAEDISSSDFDEEPLLAENSENSENTGGNNVDEFGVENDIEILEEPDLIIADDDETAAVSSDWSERLNFNGGAWLLFAICVFYYSSVFPLISQGVKFFSKWFHVDESTARMLNSVVYTMSLPASPIFGFMVDRTRKNVFWVAVAIILSSCAHGLMAASHYIIDNPKTPNAIIHALPWVAVTLLGTGYSLLACSLWPMVSFIVPKEKLGTAYGFMQAIQNLGLALTAMLSGVIVDKGGYMQLLMFFLSFQAIALFCCLMLWKKHGINCEPIPESYEGSRRQSRVE